MVLFEKGTVKCMKKRTVISMIIVAIAVLLIVVILIFIRNKDNTYRLLKVYEVNGAALVTREDIGEIEPNSNMVLESGDIIALDNGVFVIQADNDKYIS